MSGEILFGDLGNCGDLLDSITVNKAKWIPFGVASPLLVWRNDEDTETYGVSRFYCIIVLVPQLLERKVVDRLTWPSWAQKCGWVIMHNEHRDGVHEEESVPGSQRRTLTIPVRQSIRQVQWGVSWTAGTGEEEEGQGEGGGMTRKGNLWWE